MTESDKLCYYSKSKHVDAGSGCNEFVGNISKYSELNKIKDWRRILSNFYVEPFEYEGNIYNSVEHAFQSCKIRLANNLMRLSITNLNRLCFTIIKLITNIILFFFLNHGNILLILATKFQIII